jgi:hypothetical protein
MALHKYAIEDTTNNVAQPIPGNFTTAKREAFKLAEYKKAPAIIWKIAGAVWEREAIVTP